MTTFEQVTEAVLADDKQYTGSWAKESLIWDRLEVNKRVADLISPKSGQIHVDLGTGFGFLLAELKKRNPNSVIFGVDKTPVILIAAAEVLSMRRQCHCNVLVNMDFACNEDGKIERVFMDDPDFDRLEPMRIGNHVNLLCDDIRNLELLKKILGSRKLSSGSFVFPGTARNAIWESPYPIEKMDPAEQQRRIHEVMAQTRDAVYKFVSEYVKKDGVFVTAERIAIVDETAEREVPKDMHRRMGKYAQYWNHDGGSTLVGNLEGKLFGNRTANGKQISLSHEKGSEIDLVAERDTEEDEIRRVTVSVQKFRRNKRKFREKSSFHP